MNKLFIYEYINKITKENIYNYGLNQGINLEKKDLDIIYYYVKNEYKRFFNNPEDILLEVKDKLSNNTYNKILQLYNKYKNMLNYLK
ncbi:MAG: hypothetical protein IJZ79_04180 [Bacilli bacterium]|nr:hypothetical protein [Bacilli bacterium]